MPKNQLFKNYPDEEFVISNLDKLAAIPGNLSLANALLLGFSSS